MKTLIKGKKILITGGTGTVGRLLVKEMLQHEPAVVRILSRDESKQFEMHKELMDVRNVRFFIGDVRDKDRMLHAMEDVDYVFHTAAMKHVIACEYNPFEALKTNLEGSRNVIEAALANGVKKVILTSTDKATNPCNTMGVSKLFAERLFTAANYYKGGHETAFASVRFGNIMGSRGSVIPLFKRQIESGGPITITDPEMTRFVITTRQSTDFVFRATKLAKGGEIFILKMPVICMRDLLDVMIDMFGPSDCRGRKKIQVRIIGAQPGEKVYEELMTEEESTRAVELPDMYVLQPQIRDLFTREYKYPHQKKPSVTRFISHDLQPMGKDEIQSLIREIYSL